MKHRNNHLLVGYWAQLRKNGCVPDQTDLDPRAIKRILPHVFILDASDVKRPRYRLAGTSHCDRYGVELRGTNFLGHWEIQSHASLVQLFRQSLLAGRPVCLSSLAQSEAGLAELETVLAPLRLAGVAPSRFIGISQIMGDSTALIGNPVIYERLVASHFVQETEPLSPPDRFQPPPSDFWPASRAPHLRLVVNREQPRTSSDSDLLVRHFTGAVRMAIPPLHAAS